MKECKRKSLHWRCTSLGLAEACDEIIHIVSLGFILTPFSHIHSVCVGACGEKDKELQKGGKLKLKKLHCHLFQGRVYLMFSFLYEQTRRVLSAFLWKLRKPFAKPFFSGHDPRLPENSPQQHGPAPPYNSKQGRQDKETIAWFISIHWFPGGDVPSFLPPLNDRALLSLVFISSQSGSSGHVRKGPGRQV